jgi:citrate lyase beta subunit
VFEQVVGSGLHDLQAADHLVHVHDEVVGEVLTTCPLVDTAYSSVVDIVELTREAALASDVGMSAKTCIHPSQVGPIGARLRSRSGSLCGWGRSR